MHPTSRATTTSPATALTTATITATTTTTTIPTMRAAEVRRSLLDLPNEMFFQIAVQLMKGGYPVFFSALSNLALVSRRTAELIEGAALRIQRMHKPRTTDSVWLWTKMQNFVNEQIRGGRDARLEVAAGLNRLLKPGMQLVPREGRMLDALLSAKHAALPCSTIAFDIPVIALQSIQARPSIFPVGSQAYYFSMQGFQSFEEVRFCEDIARFLLQNARIKERPEIFVTWYWGVSGFDDTLRALADAAVKYEKAFLKLICKSEQVFNPIPVSLDVLRSGKVISIDLNARPMRDGISKELMQAVRKADSLQHLRIHCFSDPYNADKPNWAGLLPELNGHASLRKLTILHWGPAETTREHLEKLPDCPHLDTVEFRLCVDTDEEVEEESRKMQELVDTIRLADKGKFSVTFVVGTTYPGNVEI